MFLHVLEHTLEDTLRMLPFLYLAYLFIEYIEQRQGQRIERALAGGGRWGPSLNRQYIYRKLGVHSKAGVLKASRDLRLRKG